MRLTVESNDANGNSKMIYNQRDEINFSLESSKSEAKKNLNSDDGIIFDVENIYSIFYKIKFLRST